MTRQRLGRPRRRPEPVRRVSYGGRRVSPVRKRAPLLDQAQLDELAEDYSGLVVWSIG